MTDVVVDLRVTEVDQVSEAQNKDVHQRPQEETALLSSQKGNIGAHILVSSEDRSGSRCVGNGRIGGYRPTRRKLSATRLTSKPTMLDDNGLWKNVAIL